MRKYVIWYLVCAMFVIGVAPRLEAAFSPSETLALSPAARAADAETIRSALEQKLVRQRLADIGFSADEITARLSELSDEQVHYFASKLDELKAGGDGLGLVIGILVIVVIVIVIIQLTGHKVVVK